MPTARRPGSRSSKTGTSASSTSSASASVASPATSTRDGSSACSPGCRPRSSTSASRRAPTCTSRTCAARPTTSSGCCRPSRAAPADDEDEDAADAARAGGGARIEDLLKEGQEIIVQVTKEPISTKGARTTRYISLPGRHLVFMPTVDHIGISRRIASDKERRRLRDIVESMRPAGSGFIVRTVADGGLRARAQGGHGVPDQALERGRPARGERALSVADLQRPRPAAADGARSVHAPTSRS